MLSDEYVIVIWAEVIAGDGSLLAQGMGELILTAGVYIIQLLLLLLLCL